MPSTSFYLGPRKPRLQAESWDEMVIAAAAGVLDETRWVERGTVRAQEQVDRLAALLSAAGLDADSARRVAFHAGLPWQPDQIAQPGGEPPLAPVVRRRSGRDWFSRPQ